MLFDSKEEMGSTPINLYVFVENTQNQVVEEKDANSQSWWFFGTACTHGVHGDPHCNWNFAFLA